MKLARHELEIRPEDPFAKDVLRREQFANSLTTLIGNCNESLVLSLTAPWGEGKTTFLRMWLANLALQNKPHVYFDAFAHDYMDDPFIALAGEISAAMERTLPAAKRKKLVGDWRKKAAKVGARLFTFSTRVAVKAATMGAVQAADLEALKNVGTDLADGAASAAEKLIEERLKHYEESKSELEQVRCSLSCLADTVREETGFPLLFVIDELDRCRPSYAVEVLERVKHIFSVRSVVFVLAMHRNQMEESIRSIFGQGIDAGQYLQKFLDFDIRLPKRTEDRHNNDHWAYCNRLAALHEVELNDRGRFIKYFAELSRNYGLPLRQTEKAFSTWVLAKLSCPHDRKFLDYLVALLCVLKVRAPDLFSKLLSIRIDETEFLRQDALISSPTDDTSSSIRHTIQLVRACLMSEEAYLALGEDSDLAYLKKRDYFTWEVGIPRRDVLPWFATLIDTFRLPE